MNVVPILPTSKVKYVIVDKNAPMEFLEYLTENEINYIFSKSVDNVLPMVSTHPDMQVCNVGNKTFVVEGSTYEYYYNILSPLGVKVIKGEFVKSNYPYDIAYNVVITGKHLIHNIDYTEKNILQLTNSRISSTKQGYTKCATCIISENAVISADKSIYKTCQKNIIDCLLIEKDNISLGNRKDGFIGGCCGMIGKDKLLFCGDITKHKSYSLIKNFLDKYNVEIIVSHSGSLTDIGSIIPVMQE